MMDTQQDTLIRFANEHSFYTKGPLSVALVVTNCACDEGLPLDPEDLKSLSGRRVLGLCASRVQRILARHGVKRELARDPGRDRPGRVQDMEHYVALLNQLDAEGIFDGEAAEAFWVDRVCALFATRSLEMIMDPDRSLSATLSGVLAEAKEREARLGRDGYVQRVLEHLVAAALTGALQPGERTSEALFQPAKGDPASQGLVVGNSAIFVCARITEAAMMQCKSALRQHLRPVIMTPASKKEMALGLADIVGIADRVDVFEVEPLLAAGLYQRGKFTRNGCNAGVKELVRLYNERIDRYEIEDTLRIEVVDG